MGDEIELAAKSIGEVVTGLAEQSGALAPTREYGEYIATRVHLRHLPKLVERSQAVAQRLLELGLPRKAWDQLDEPLVTAILESMAEETDPELVEAWENLLANTIAETERDVRRGFPDILHRLDPRDARLLEHWGSQATEETFRVTQHTTMPAERDRAALETLTSLGLLQPTRHLPTTPGGIRDDGSTIVGYSISELGWAFLCAVRPPHAR